MNKTFFLVLCISYSLLYATKNEFFPSSEDLTKIAKKIWYNECSGSVDLLTCWRIGEDWASVGILHMIWCPAGNNSRFTQTFPSFLNFVKEHKRQIPEYLTLCTGCPWKTREKFYDNFHSKEMVQLRKFLYDTIDLQILFLMQQFQKFQTAAPFISAIAGKNSHVQRNLTLLTQNVQGWYVLLDYLNFKGEGTNFQERYSDRGWGLLQVLQQMKPTFSTASAIKEFAHAARNVLNTRVMNAPLAQKEFEKKWLPGWMNRIQTYVTYTI